MTRLGLRARLTASLITVIIATVAAVGVSSALFVERSLRARLVEQALAVTEFNLTVLVPATGLSRDVTAADVEAAGLIDRFLRRGTAGAWIEFPDGSQVMGGTAPRETSDEFDRIVERGEVGYEFTSGADGEILVTASRLPPDGPVFFFVTSAEDVAATTRQVLVVIAITGLVAILVGAVVASALSRRIVRPVADARQASERIAAGDLAVRVPVETSDELGGLAASFNRMADSLRTMIDQLDAARDRERRFVADVSHELRTPLTALVNEAKMLLDRMEDGRGSSEDSLLLARLLDEDVSRLRHLVEDLLEVSRLDSESEALRPTETDVTALLSALIAARHPEAGLTADLPGPLLVDSRGLERVVGNLLDNARQHAPGAAVTVTARLDEGDLVVTVADQGPGVSAEALPRLFERFSTADEARSSGTGLGLAIAAQHAERMGGTLEAGLRAGGGMLFTLQTPVTELLHGGEGPETSVSHSGIENPAEEKR